jgi:hypothetical protein
VPESEPVLALAFRPHSRDLAVATTTAVTLLHETGAPERLATRVAEPAQWSSSISPSGRTLAVHLGNQLVALSLADGSVYPTRLLPGPSTGSYRGVLVPSDEEVRLPERFGEPGRSFGLTDRAVRSVPPSTSPDGSVAVLVDGAGVRLESHAGTVRLQAQREGATERPTPLAVAFRADSRALFLIETLNLPRSAGGRVSEWSVDDGTLSWSESVESPESLVPTRQGVIVSGASVERFEGGKRVFLGRRAPFAYSSARDWLALVDSTTIQLVGPVGSPRVVPLPFPEPVQSLAFDLGATRLALGTKQGLHVVELPTGREVAQVELGAPVEALGFRDDLAIVRRVSPLAPERSFGLVDVRSGATLTIGFALTGGAAPLPFALASNGWVDGEPAVLGSLFDAEHPDVPVPAACAHPGLLREWLSAP